MSPLFQNSVKKGKKDPKQSTQLYLKVSEIRDDTAILKDGSLRGVLKVSSINLNLKSEQEQNAVIYSYQSFLNMLEFPVQIVIRSKKLDLDNYIEKLKKIGVAQSNPLLQKQTFEYIDYISRLVEYADIMEKEFYVVVPQEGPGQAKKGLFQSFMENLFPKNDKAAIDKRHKNFGELKKKLEQRVNTVSGGLQSCNLRVERLETQKLIELFYETYNPLTSRNQKFEPEDQLAVEMDENTSLKS